MLFFTSMILSGCWDHSEPERMLYVYGVAVDYKDDEYVVYTQIIDLANTAKSEQPVAEKVQSEVGRATGRTADEAFVKLYNSMGQRAFWGHLSYVIFSEDMLKEGKINQVLDLFLRYRETRYRVSIYSTKDDVKDVLLTTPITNKSISVAKLADPLNSFKQESFVVPVNFRTLLIGLNEPSHETTIPLISATENWETVEGKSTVISFLGVSVVSPNELKGIFMENDIKGLQWMSNETKRADLTIDIDSNQDRLAVTLSKIKVKVKPVIEGDSVQFDITVKAGASVGLIETPLTVKEISDIVSEEVKRDIKHTFNKALKNDIDIYRLSEHVYRKDLKTWKRLENDGKIPLTEESIRDLKVEIKVSGGRKNLKRTVD